MRDEKHLQEAHTMMGSIMLKMQNSDEFIKVIYDSAWARWSWFRKFFFFLASFTSTLFARRRHSCLFASHWKYFMRCVVTVSLYILLIFFFSSHNSHANQIKSNQLICRCLDLKCNRPVWTHWKPFFCEYGWKVMDEKIHVKKRKKKKYVLTKKNVDWNPSILRL